MLEITAVESRAKTWLSSKAREDYKKRGLVRRENDFAEEVLCRTLNLFLSGKSLCMYLPPCFMSKLVCCQEEKKTKITFSSAMATGEDKVYWTISGYPDDFAINSITSLVSIEEQLKENGFQTMIWRTSLQVQNRTPVQTDQAEEVSLSILELLGMRPVTIAKATHECPVAPPST